MEPEHIQEKVKSEKEEEDKWLCEVGKTRSASLVRRLSSILSGSCKGYDTDNVKTKLNVSSASRCASLNQCGGQDTA